ncbi:MAG: 2-oxo acid dehydrogenase subunit E2 [Kiritimatiellae bacterium]|nr:2-oxo acid dehydrogenase subunit E2 [Kiritimatiellia bacterium]
MPHAVAMPKPGQFTEECTILRWHKREGDPVAKGDILFEIETDKANMEVESFYEGTLLKIIAKEGATVPVQATVAFIGQPGEAIPEVAPPAPAARSAVAPAATRTAAVVSSAPAVPARVSAETPPPEPVSRASSPMPVAPVAPVAEPSRLRISPRARRRAREAAIDPARVPGSGPGGRITERDVNAWLEAQGYAALRITPAAKELARREGVDILTVRGTGEHGRIRVEDVQRAIAERPQPMSRMRQVIAQRLTHSFTTTPHFFVTVPVDMTELLAFRQRLKAEGAPYTVTDFIAEAVVQALVEFPQMNSHTDGRQVWRSTRVHLGIAVALDAGLVVPVVRDADELSFLELHERAAALVEKARAGKLTPDEMSGGTFTISNMGMLDVEQFTAIINPGEGAILAVASTRATPWVRDGRVEVRQIMRITLSADHRLVDGATAARFANAIRVRLEDPAVWRSWV